MRIRPVMQLAALALIGTWAWAQDAPRAEVAFDYSFARYNPSASYTKGHSLNGGGGQFKFNVTHNLGIMMDLQGYNSNTTSFNISPNTALPSQAARTVRYRATCLPTCSARY